MKKSATQNSVLVALALLTAGCNVTWRDNWQVDTRQTAIIAAQTRRTQLITEIEVLERALRRTVAIDSRAVIQSNINRLRYEVEQLNAVIQ